MSVAENESLVDAVRRSGAAAKEAAGGAIAALAGVAERLEMRETALRLADTRAELDSDTFKIIVMGRFKNGKSTLLNALMGGTTREVRLGGHKGPMVTDDLPATATLTAVRYAEEPYVKAWSFDGRSETWSLDRYLRESTLDIDEQESQRRFGHIREFEMGFPARLCQAGVTVYDSPGLDDHESRSLITRDATARCDAAIVVYRSDVLMGQNELMDAAGLVADGTRIFTVINLWGERAVDDRLRGFVWNRYVRDQLGGPRWDNQDLAARDIYFVNGGRARDARYPEAAGTPGGEPSAVTASGLAELEARLGEFLIQDRQHAHLSRFTTRAFNLGDLIDKHLAQRRLAAQTDQESLRHAYAEAAPRLEHIRSRPRKLAAVFQRFRDEAQNLLVASFLQTVVRLRQELPGHLAATPLPSGEKFSKLFRQKKMQDEAAGVVSAFVTDRLDDWGQKEVNELLRPLVERLGEEVETEIAAIGRQYDEIHFELTGWRVDPGQGAIIGTTERVLSAVAGLFFGDVSAALTGGAGGWRGAAGGISGALGMGFLLAAVGVTAGAVFFPLTLAAAATLGMLGATSGLEKRVKDAMATRCDPLLAELATEVEPKIAAKLADDFVLLEKTVTEELLAVIDEEERNIRTMVELNQRDQEDRTRVLAELADLGADVAKHRMALQQALVIAQQV
jgi:hypothetical protein